MYGLRRYDVSSSSAAAISASDTESAPATAAASAIGFTSEMRAAVGKTAKIATTCLGSGSPGSRDYEGEKTYDREGELDFDRVGQRIFMIF